MVMGFGEREGRLGLRATNGDVTKAIQHIIERRKVRNPLIHGHVYLILFLKSVSGIFYC